MGISVESRLLAGVTLRERKVPSAEDGGSTDCELEKLGRERRRRHVKTMIESVALLGGAGAVGAYFGGWGVLGCTAGAVGIMGITTRGFQGKDGKAGFWVALGLGVIPAGIGALGHYWGGTTGGVIGTALTAGLGYLMARLQNATSG